MSTSSIHIYIKKETEQNLLGNKHTRKSTFIHGALGKFFRQTLPKRFRYECRFIFSKYSPSTSMHFCIRKKPIIETVLKVFLSQILMQLTRSSRVSWKKLRPFTSQNFCFFELLSDDDHLVTTATFFTVWFQDYNGETMIYQQ